MDQLAYDVKRAHLGMTWTALRRLETEAEVRTELRYMTPARFEILSTILSYADVVGIAPQLLLTQIIHKLGLDRSTIARSVRRMETLGYVVRLPHPGDRRCLIVMITELGLRAMSSARELLALKPNFLYERVRKWLGMIGRRDNAAAHKTRAIEAQLLAGAFGYLSHPIFDPAYDHRTIFLASKFKRNRRKSDKLQDKPLLPPPHCRMVATCVARQGTDLQQRKPRW